MGQSMSRRSQQARPETQSAPRTSRSTSSSSEFASRTPASSMSDKRSKRLSLRRSVMGLLPHSPSSGSVSSDVSQGSKRRWRSSRRWSKTPEQLAEFEVPDSANVPHAGPSASTVEQASQHEDEEVACQPTSDGPSAEELSEPERRESLCSKETHPDSTHEDGDERRAPSLHSPVRLPTMYEDSREDEGAPRHQEVSQDYNDIVDAAIEAQPEAVQGVVPQIHIDSEADRMQVDISRSSESDVQQATSVPQVDAIRNTEPAPQAPRQFPPPGTLVVVQGVVNTTDAPSNNGASASSRPARYSAPRPVSLAAATPSAASMRRSGSTPPPGSRTEERLSTRNRLSAFIPRPASMLSRRSSDDGRASAHRNSISSDAPSHIARENSGSEDSTASAPSSDDSDGPSTENDGRPRPLSPGSIDVLGTLLSVAAAATAASLFSPGFSGNGAANGNLPGLLERPTSPTPTAGLGGSGGLGALAGLGLGQGAQNGAQAQRDGRDRIRQVWESFRDRLGLNARNGNEPATATPGESQSNGTDGDARLRPGELMLAEMARALNVGLGLNGEGGAAGRTQETETGEPSPGGTSGPNEPAEDSFERFLINLQADLRAVLTADGASAPGREDARNGQDGDQPDTDNQPQDHTEPVAGPSSPRAATTSIVSDVIRPEPTTEGGDEDEDMDTPPPLAEVSDSDEDDDNDADEESRMDVDGEDIYHRDAHSARRTPTPIPPAGLPFGLEQRPAGTHMEGDRRPGINLWRLYRFQPIPAAQTQGHAASTSQGQQTGTAPESTTSSAPPASQPSPSTTSSGPSAEPTAASPSTTTPAPSTTAQADVDANVVVPVIVVGLQSVEMGQSQTRVRDGGDRTHTQESDDASTSGYGGSVFEGTAHGEDSSATSAPRGRTWSSRAANALRTLRPGRRGSRGRGASEGSGSRTFLIYVIGGYYPPNHHMVTGSDSLDSYEALWELAELLGQVKPPTATREDIEKSGLEIVQASDLPELEKSGRVASNCTERCLICLDDYDADDQLRLMSCKHAFHMDCVDKWLQVGRNNCPACRTRGVSTPGDTPS